MFAFFCLPPVEGDYGEDYNNSIIIKTKKDEHCPSFPR